jgi:Holliday junction resolvasome RuvABC DNA-binding subunit
MFEFLHSAEVRIEPAAYRINKGATVPFIVFSFSDPEYHAQQTFKILAGHKINAEVGTPLTLYFYSEHNERLGLQTVCFADPDMVEVFTSLVKLPGIGFTAAARALSIFYGCDSLRTVAREGDVKKIAEAPGVGGKTASKLLQAIQDIFKQEHVIKEEVKEDTQYIDDAVSALAALGYKKIDMRPKVIDVAYRLKITDTSEIIRAVLSGR